MTTNNAKLARLARQALKARAVYFEAEQQRQAVAFALSMGRYDALSSRPEVVTQADTAYRSWVACEKAYALQVGRVKR